MGKVWILFILLLIQCHDDERECKSGEWMCHDNKAYYCGHAEEWILHDDCNSKGSELKYKCVHDKEYDEYLAYDAQCIYVGE